MMRVSMWQAVMWWAWGSSVEYVIARPRIQRFGGRTNDQGVLDDSLVFVYIH